MSDILSRLLRAADPGTVHRGDALSERGLRELAHYEAAEAELEHAREPRTRVWAWRPLQLVTGSASLAMFAIAVIVLAIVHPSPATALTPRLLELTPVTATAEELLREMEAMRRSAGAASNVIRAQTWALSTAIAEDGTIESSTVEPHWSETTFDVDGTVRYRLVAAEPFAGQDTERLAEPGTVLADETFPPGTWAFPSTDGPPTDASEVGAYLTQFTGLDTLTSGDVMREIAGILSNFPLTAEQEAALIGYLITLDGITVAGQTTDRLGRTGVVFTADDRAPGEFEDLLIISPETGQILASETIYIGADRPEVRAPFVIDYTAWER